MSSIRSEYSVVNLTRTNHVDLVAFHTIIWEIFSVAIVTTVEVYADFLDFVNRGAVFEVFTDSF